MYKGYKVTKHLQRYMGYAKVKYEKASIDKEVDLWDILKGYDYIMQQAKCIQLYIYDWILNKIENQCFYIKNIGSDGCIYIKN